jgi:diguanylate cyclase (GGDEF)-like protein
MDMCITTAARPTGQPRFTGVAILDDQGAIVSCNAMAAASLAAKNPVGRLFCDILVEAISFGLISNFAASQIRDGVETGTSTFHTTDGRTFLFRSQLFETGKALEWTDVSAALASIDRYDLCPGMLSRSGFLAAVTELAKVDNDVTIVHLDLDNFREINEVFGQEIGDKLIRRVGERISAECDCDSGHLAHGAGGEFFLVTQQANVLPLSEAIREILRRPHLIDGKMVYSTASMGFAHCTETDGAEFTLRNAGMALRKAQSVGGDQSCAFTAEMRQSMHRKQILETELRKALALRQFSLVYQPQYKIKQRQLVGFEALLRWSHPDLGVVSPGEFIPLAEELGLILPIGEWVLRTACKKAATWPVEISISANVSPLQFRSTTIVPMVAAALEASGLDPRRLDLEVTEGAILLNSAPIMDNFHRLKAIGVKFSMDDFGTGYSSLSYLRKFPFDKIKIDQSFIRSLSADREGLAIIRAICALGHTLGLATIAEGVETEEELRQIEEEGCQLVQGYLTGRPLAPNVADSLAASSASYLEMDI